MKYAKRWLIGLERPRHGGDVRGCDGVLDFSCSLNPLGPPREVVAAALSGLDKVSCYPDDSCSLLKSELSLFVGVAEDLIAVGCGSTELIKSFADAFVEPGDHILVEHPTYSEYAFYCRLAGGVVEEVPLCEEHGFALDVDCLFERLDSNTRAVFLCNPNNPTSRLESKKRIMEVVEECEAREVLVFVDEAFIDFLRDSRRFSCVPEVEGHENLFVSRSLTKIFSVPGLRVGYGVGGRGLVECLDKVRLSWGVGVLEQLVAVELLRRCAPYLERTVEVVERERDYLYRSISEIAGYTVFKPDANFIFIKVGGLGVGAAAVRSALLGDGVLVRDCSSFGGEFSNFIRVGVKERELNEVLVKALRGLPERLKGSALETGA
ncbi:MAG: histidinol-phosphate aminotransferase family protein [Candidatus Freyarchaeota archaeon]|nr:histidinol-phosphate aminotransferase family protein [Candidatus Jordarchaeia archaeon]